MKLKYNFFKLGPVHIQLCYSLVYFSILFITFNWNKKHTIPKSTNVWFGFTIGFALFADAFGSWGFHFGFAWPKRNLDERDKFGFYKKIILKKRTLKESMQQIAKEQNAKQK